MELVSLKMLFIRKLFLYLLEHSIKIMKLLCIGQKRRKTRQSLYGFSLKPIKLCLIEYLRGWETLRMCLSQSHSKKKQTAMGTRKRKSSSNSKTLAKQRRREGLSEEEPRMNNRYDRHGSYDYELPERFRVNLLAKSYYNNVRINRPAFSLIPSLL